LPEVLALLKVEMVVALAAEVVDILKAVLVVVSKVEITVDFLEQMGVILCHQGGQHRLQAMVEQMEFVE
jgi:hypothetical protein